MGKQITLTFYFFTWSVIGQQNNTIKIGVPGFFDCSGVPECSGVPVFLVLVHAKLRGVLDLQLFEVIYRRENRAGLTAYSLQFSNKYGRGTCRSQRTDEVEKIYGFGRCIELYLQDAKLTKIKNKGKQLLKKDEKVWKKRPLTDELIQYYVVDTMAMFRLYDKMKDVSRAEEARLRVASQKYVNLYRGKTVRSFDGYEMNAFLPLDIIPDKGTTYFPAANTACTRCERRFPREEFSATQLRNGEGKCRVCKEVKRLEDVQRNREELGTGCRFQRVGLF